MYWKHVINDRIILRLQNSNDFKVGVKVRNYAEFEFVLFRLVKMAEASL